MTCESVSARFCCRKKLALYSRFALVYPLPPPLLFFLFLEQKFEVKIARSCSVCFPVTYQPCVFCWGPSAIGWTSVASTERSLQCDALTLQSNRAHNPIDQIPKVSSHSVSSEMRLCAIVETVTCSLCTVLMIQKPYVPFRLSSVVIGCYNFSYPIWGGKKVKR